MLLLPLGWSVGRYRIEARLGGGGMGEVYRARDTLLEREVALKTIAANVIREGAEGSSAAEARFLREARAHAALRHPSVVAVYDAGVHLGTLYLAMELVTGRSLDRVMRDANVGLATRIQWLLEIASALGAAHAAGLVHRDVKPSNIMITDDGAAKVLDFGLARPVRSGDDVPPTFHTADGCVPGTPRYMAPEQLAGATIDASADQFAWGVLAYRVLGGQHPADAARCPPGTPAAMLREPPPLDAVAPSLPSAMAKVVARAMALDPAQRYASMDEAAIALEAAAEAVESSPDSALAPATTGEFVGGRYELLEEIGRGGAAVVHRAYDVMADTVVAVKLRPRGGEADDRLLDLRRELQLARRVTHPNVVRIYDLVELPGHFGLSMELVEGESLDERIARGPLGRDATVALALHLAHALAAAHRAGVVHRDLKPANVLLRASNGAAVVTDFGVSRALGDQSPAARATRPDSALAGNHGSALVGTPQYMAPEQLAGESDVGPSADVYAFGLVMFEAVTGRRPHEGATLDALRRARETAVRLDAVRPDLPSTLRAAIGRALAVRPCDRFASGVELLGALTPPVGRAPPVPERRAATRSAGMLARRAWRMSSLASKTACRRRGARGRERDERS